MTCCGLLVDHPDRRIIKAASSDYRGRAIILTYYEDSPEICEFIDESKFSEVDYSALLKKDMVIVDGFLCLPYYKTYLVSRDSLILKNIQLPFIGRKRLRLSGEDLKEGVQYYVDEP